MGKSYPYLFFILWLSYLIVSALLLFTWGYLLRRETQNYNSTCISIGQLPCPQENDKYCSAVDKTKSILDQYDIAHSVCLHSSSKVVLLIIDALRYDFIVYDAKNKNPLPFQNKVPVIHKLMHMYPHSTRLYKFIADPPTTTMQRLKALTTGSLPTFIDVGSNFASPEISEDNLLDQLYINNCNTVFLGDDTWKGLYPGRFLRNYFYPSFNVWDLDTVDYGVRDNLFLELNKTDWNLLIGHFLGVDHCGHRYGPNHLEMKRKLEEMNNIIKNVVDEIDGDTVLFIVGDHGMTTTGDHGGDSELETNAGMFVFSKKPLRNIGPKVDAVQQISLVPTLSTILGVPIPFQNLGILIMNSLPVVGTEGISEWKLALFSLWSNIQQMVDYIKTYEQNTNTFAEKKISTLYEKYSVFRSKIHSIDSEEKFESFSNELITFAGNIKTMCEEAFIQFEPFLMARGLIFLFLSIFFLFLLTDGVPLAQLPELFKSSFLTVLYSTVCIVSIIVIICFAVGIVEDLLPLIFFANGLISQVMLGVLVIQNWDVISLHWYSKSKIQKCSSLICQLVFMFNICGMFSNSFILEESHVLLYLVATIIILIGLECMNSTNLRKHVFKLFLITTISVCLIRISAKFWTCREEQQWCFLEPATLMNSKQETTKLEWVVNVVQLAVCLIALKIWLKNCGNLNGFSFTVTLIKLLPTVILVCISGYWVLRRLPRKPLQLKSVNYLAHSAYFMVGLGIFTTIWKPLCVYILPKEDDLAIQTDYNIIPQLYRKIKNCFAEKNKTDMQHKSEDIPVICGLGTVYSSAFIMISIYLVLLLALLLGDMFTPSAVIMVATAASCLFLTSLLRIERATSIENLFEVPNIIILLWILQGQYFFFASGHQPTFPNIQWDAAFIGTSGVFSNNIIPGTLIIINTFCSYILFGFLLPLVVIFPFTLFVMMPSIIGKKTEFHLVAQRGEVTLFEKDELLFASVFTAACKYIVGHGLKLFTCMLAATIHCRHLMAWKVFAPKFIFESIALLVTLASVVIAYLILIRVNRQVEKLIIKLNKTS